MKYSMKSMLAAAPAFLAAASGAGAQEGSRQLAMIERRETFWKPDGMDVVIRLQPCPDTVACGEIYWYNPQDQGVMRNFRDPDLSRRQPQNLCGYSPRMDFERVADNRWDGEMEVRGRRMTVQMEVTRVDDNTLDFFAYVNDATRGLFNRRETWRRVEPGDPRYPQCRR
jgi:hypothetical protein